ncbi:MAG TPA: hypothetical protein VGL53_28130 [Bryobacteraceae bacterium]|jgi:hypothetical protein
MILTKPHKSHFSESEAAAEIGVSIDELRSLIKSFVVDREEDLNNVPSATFQPSDLVLLRILAKQRPAPVAV